jgi:endo-1,4-beta-D-glucanase Y
MKNTFSQEGRYHSRDGSVTSESQAYAMLRAVWMDDRDEFDRTWQWTRENLINSNGLLSWQWKDGAVTDPSSNAGADTQAALALILGGRRWGDPALVEGGTAMIQSIREHEVIVIAGRPYMAAGDWAVNTDPLAANPSYFSPFAYRVFEEVDPDGGWTEILASGYQLARDSANISFAGEAAAGLPPDWIGIRREDGQLVKLELAGNEDTTRYGYIAPRLFWQVALDYNLTQDSRAQEILNQAGFIGEQVRQRGFPGSVYAHDGTMITGESTPVANAGALSVLVVRDPQAAERFFRDQYVDRAQHPQSEQAAWGDPSDLSNQEWAWFAVGMYNNNLLLYQK